LSDWKDYDKKKYHKIGIKTRCGIIMRVFYQTLTTIIIYVNKVFIHYIAVTLFFCTFIPASDNKYTTRFGIKQLVKKTYKHKQNIDKSQTKTDI